MNYRTHWRSYVKSHSNLLVSLKKSVFYDNLEMSWQCMMSTILKYFSIPTQSSKSRHVWMQRDLDFDCTVHVRVKGIVPNWTLDYKPFDSLWKQFGSGRIVQTALPTSIAVCAQRLNVLMDAFIHVWSQRYLCLWMEVHSNEPFCPSVKTTYCMVYVWVCKLFQEG